MAHNHYPRLRDLSLTFSYQNKELNDYPGPFLASYTDIWRVWNTWSNRHGNPYKHLHDKYGEIVRLGPNMLSFSNPKAIKDIYGVQQNFMKSDYHLVAQATVKGIPQNTLFSCTDQAWHSSLRKAISPAFTMTSLIQYEPYINNTISIFLEVLEKEARKGKSVDMTKWFEYFAWDVIGELTYGERQGFLESGSDIWGILKPIEVKLQYMVLVGQIPWLDKFLSKNPILMWLDAHGWTNTTNPAVAFAIKHQTAHKALRETKPAQTSGGSSKTGPKDLLDKFLDAQELDPEIVTDREVMSVSLMMLFAGAGTTAITLTAILYFLLKNPISYKKLREEITALPVPTTFTAAQRLPYLDACIKEGFRLHPVLAFIPERIVSSPGATISDKFIPAGTLVGVSPWIAQRDKEIYGEDAEVYRPERWLGFDEEEDKLKEMNRTLFNFGSGPHVCLGKNIALMEMYKVLPELLRRFEIGLVDPGYVLETNISNFLTPGPLWVRLR